MIALGARQLMLLPACHGEITSMVRDPRFLNEQFDTSSIGNYLTGYINHLTSALEGVDKSNLDRARILVERASEEGKRIYTIGNGGSAAIADHLCCDWTKGTHSKGHPIIDTCSLSANSALYSAIANDYGFEKVFSTQIEFTGRAGDVLVAISSSGNSRNIVNAVASARAAGLATIGLSGFSGGALRKEVDVSLHIAANNYGIVEDAHQALMHVLAQYIASRRDAGNPS